MTTASQYVAAIEARRVACETDIALLPEAIELKLALYADCQRIALENHDLHGANNWAHTILMTQAVRDMRTAA